MLTILLLILISIGGAGISVYYLRKNIIRIAQKNTQEPKVWKRAMNYPLTVIWYGYLIVFFVGLSVNNLIFT